jgi:hypothetical protein
MNRRRLRFVLAALAVALALNAALWLAQGGFALPAVFGDLLGSKLVRAEIVTKDGGTLHDYRIDRGRVTAATSGSITLLEADGTSVSVPVAPGATVVLNGSPASVSALHRGLVATTLRDGNGPATRVQARGARRRP